MLAGIFLFGLIASMVSWSMIRSDKILSFVPVDTVIYLKAENSIWPWVSKNISDLPFDNFYLQTEQTFGWPVSSFKSEILAHSSELALLFMPNQAEDQLNLVLIIKSQDEPVIKTLSALPYHLALTKNIVAFSDSEPAIQKLAAVKAGETFPLSMNLNSDQLTGHLLAGYFNLDNLKRYLASDNLVTKIASQFFTGRTYLALDQANNGFQFKVLGEQDFGSAAGSRGLLIDGLPADFSFFISNLDLSNLLSLWAEVDPAWSKNLDQTKAAFAAVYDFDFSQGLTELFARPVDLIILPSAAENIFGFDFIIAFPATKKEVAGQLEKLINIILAQKQPTEVKRLLPDGSSVAEVVAEPESFIWQDQEFAGGKFRHLSSPDLKFEIAYSLQPDRFIIASSVDQLKKFFIQSDITITDLAKDCRSVSNNFMAFDPAAVGGPFDRYIPAGRILFSQLESSALSGCILGR